MLEMELPRSDKWRGLKTRWTSFDYFIERLAEKGDEICNESEIKNRYYEELRSLVCNGNTDVLKTIKLGPYYHFILLSYYILFHKKEFDLAYKILQKIYEIYEDDKTLFDEDEDRSLHYLRLVFQRLKTIRNYCSMYEPGRGYLRITLESIATDLRETKDTVKDTWSSLFKDLLIIHLDPSSENEIRTKISQIKNTIKNISDERELLTDEIADGYNIFSGGLSMAPYYFIYQIVQKIETTIIKKFDEYKKYLGSYEHWKRRENSLKKISGELTKAKDVIIRVAVTILPILLGFLTPILPSHLANWLYENRMLLVSGILAIIWAFSILITKGIIPYIEQKINSFVETNILGDIYLSICQTR